jgi:peptide chain release factor subunit 3
MIVAANKMDDNSVEYSQDRFKETKEEITSYLRTLGYKSEKILFVPISGWAGKKMTSVANLCIQTLIPLVYVGANCWR